MPPIAVMYQRREEDIELSNKVRNNAWFISNSFKTFVRPQEYAPSVPVRNAGCAHTLFISKLHRAPLSAERPSAFLKHCRAFVSHLFMPKKFHIYKLCISEKVGNLWQTPENLEFGWLILLREKHFFLINSTVFCKCWQTWKLMLVTLKHWDMFTASHFLFIVWDLTLLKLYRPCDWKINEVGSECENAEFLSCHTSTNTVAWCCRWWVGEFRWDTCVKL